MAVLDADASAEDLAHRPQERRWSFFATPWFGPERSAGPVRSILFDGLPPDVCEDEYTDAVLFRASLLLNYTTGGQADMTFSARCYVAQRTARTGPVRIVWRIVMMSIDVLCAQMRGETEHCATAWSNFLARGRRNTF